jgi:hypothetical protein
MDAGSTKGTGACEERSQLIGFCVRVDKGVLNALSSKR